MYQLTPLSKELRRYARLTALLTVVLIPEVLSELRYVDDPTPGQVIIVGCGGEGDGVVVAAGTCTIHHYWH